MLLPGTADFNTSSTFALPPSPPVVKYDGVLNNPDQQHPSPPPPLSTELARPPPPRTPASLKSRETGSDYYTAAWGSPYDGSPSQLSRSVRTAVSEQAASDDLNELSPGLSFGLEHLVPSRLSDLNFPPPAIPQAGEYQDTFDPTNTPRSRTQRWVHLPQREDRSERTHWWSDESAPSSSDREARKRLRLSSTNSGHFSEHKPIRPSHRTRENNKTLDQQSFWETFRVQKTDNMASLLDSRWAATPEPSAEQPLPQIVQKSEKPSNSVFASRWADAEEMGKAGIENGAEPQKEVIGVAASRWAATPEPLEEPNGDSVTKSGGQTQKQPVEEISAERAAKVVKDANVIQNGPHRESERREPTVVEPLQDAPKNTAPDAAALPIQDLQQAMTAMPELPPTPAYLEPPRLKKRVSWKGKNIVISIPRFSHADAGLPVPLSREEIEERLKQFELAGYDVRGYDLTDEDQTLREGSAQARAVFPDEGETRAISASKQVRVLLPDLAKWKAYEDWLTEQKLAALGVTLGSDEPAPSTSQEMSRQSSAQQYPPLPFSPPIPSTSAGSVGRPGPLRGHSHTMSVAAPASPLNGPLGHMHRHSTFTGFGLPQGQQPQILSPGIPGLQPFNPQQSLALSALSRNGSPAQLSALRQDLGAMRGPGSPLNHQTFPSSTQDYSRGLVDDQRRRQHGYSQSLQHSTPTASFLSQSSSMRPTPVLPELREDEDEEQLEEPEPEPTVYVPPQKRAQANAEIAVPTPRGHRHNISEGLERDVLEAEQRQKVDGGDHIDTTEDENRPAIQAISGTDEIQNPLAPKPAEKDPLGDEHPVSETTHGRKKSGSRLNVAAPSFTFNPNANFMPSAMFQAPQSAFTFDAPKPVPDTMPKVNGNGSINHSRQQSSGSFNVSAPTFKPASLEFNFSSSGPSFSDHNPTGNAGKTFKIGEPNGIFGKIEIPDVVKPARRSKAIPIVRPEDRKSDASATEDVEDDQGRVAQGDAKRKQQRRNDRDGDSVPLFAKPTLAPPVLAPPPEKILGSNDVRPTSTVDEIESNVEELLADIAEKAEETIEESIEQAHKARGPSHGHLKSTSLSALAKPFEPPIPATNFAFEETKYDPVDSISDLEEGEIREDGTPSMSPTDAHHVPRVPDRNLARSSAAAPGLPEYSTSAQAERTADAEPSFDEIDAIMKQLNAEDSDKRSARPLSPVQIPSPGSHPMKGVTYLPAQDRDTVPSPSPRRTRPSSFIVHDRMDSGERTLNAWQEVRQLNRADEVPTSDWSGILSPPDEEKVQQRSNFFDSHIDKLIGRVVEQRLQPLEESLRSIHSTVNKRTRSTELKLHRSLSNVDSDADDEDEMSDEQKQRPISRGREKKIDQIKMAVIEALREQSPQRSQTTLDLSELHSVLADMKVSFARAAAASLELDDIRAVVEDSLNRQSQAVVPLALDEGKESHKRQLSELEVRLNETLAGALEEANQRRAIEARETEVRRDLRLAEEELSLLRDTARDESSKLRAMENEREDILERLDRAEDARRAAERKFDDSEAEKEALQATLEEYRMSSNRWRQDLDEGKRVREELEETIALIERQNEEYQESTSSMKRRLETLHADMATAAGQLATENSLWKSKEGEYKAKVQALESQQAVFHRERVQLEDELRVVRAHSIEVAEVRRSFEQMRHTNASMDEIVCKLQGELTEQQALAARFERQFYDAQESGRAEVHRTRMSLETEVEAANHQVNLVRAELETDLAKTRMELENMRIEAETTRARHEHLAEENEVARREALRKINHANSVALDEARHKYESAIQNLTSQHTRAISHALEDKQRAEEYLTEKLALSEAKLQHYQERTAHLEERLEIARSAAQAAALNAKASKTAAPAIATVSIPEKISPQALRESILVLQDQLQERETRIERMQVQLEEEGPAKLKERDTEINWLRELLAVRSEELADLVNTLSRPSFDRAAVRDTAIRIQANLQMEQQEKERFNRSPQTLSGQALSSLSSFATPKAAQLSSAFNKWRANMESSALKSQYARPGLSTRSYTPSKAQPRPSIPSYSSASGLMTPPASNLRSSPVPTDANAPPLPRLQSRSGSRSSAQNLTEPQLKLRSRHASSTSERPHTPLFREQSYDRDAEDQAIQMPNFVEDDDLEDAQDNKPPAFRSLESELEQEEEEIDGEAPETEA